MVKTLVVSLAKDGHVHVTEYPGVYPQQLGVTGHIKGQDSFFPSPEKGLEGIKQILVCDQAGKP